MTDTTTTPGSDSGWHDDATWVRFVDNDPQVIDGYEPVRVTWAQPLPGPVWHVSDKGGADDGC